MADIKTERLLNLTMALLATKRYLTKSEILKTVSGYSGAPDAMDRMFERDKDDLRTLGIEIEVGSLDSLFDDELGYRIRPENYVLTLPEISPTEMAYISLASQIWRDHALGESAQYALRRFQALGIETSREVEWLPVDQNLLRPDFESIWKAIEESRFLTFNYNAKKRTVWPIKLYLQNGAWYLDGIDEDLLEKRFKLIRVDGDFEVGKKGERPESKVDDSPDEDGVIVHFRFKEGSTIPFPQGNQNKGGSKYDAMVSFADHFSALHQSLSLAHIAQVLEPADLRQEILTILRDRTK